MSELDSVKNLVVAAENECAEAALMTDQARSMAEDNADYAAQMGVTAHHSVLQQVVDALSEAYRQLDEAHSNTGSAKNALNTVTDQSGRDDLAKEVTAAASVLSGVVSAMQAAIAKIGNDAASNAAMSQNEDVIQAVNAAATKTSEASTSVNTAQQQTEAYSQKLKAGPGK